MSRANNKEKYKNYDHQYYIKHKRPKSKIGQAEQKIADLEAKLAESERQYQEYRQIVDKYIEKEIDERMRDTIKEFNLDISELKQQLAEKEEEIEKWKQNVKDTLNAYSDEFVEKDKELKELRYKVKKHNQDKIELLEKVKEMANDICCENYRTLHFQIF